MMTVLSFLAALAQDMLLAAIPAAGFAMVFNVPKRALKYCALLGAIGHGSRFMLIAAGFDIVAATFWASVLVGIIGIQWSRWWLAHPKVFTVAAIIPMFPGINAYMAMLAVIKLSQSGFTPELLDFTALFGRDAPLSIGLSVPGLWLYRKRPRV